MSDARGNAAAWVAVALWVAVQLTLTSLPSDSLPAIASPIYSSGHLVMYGVLGFLVARAMLRAGHPRSRLLGVWVALALFGVLDEWHQQFIPGRYPSVTDMAFDAIGAAAGLWLGAYHMRTRWAVRPR